MAVDYNAGMRIALTLGLDATRGEKNDYVRALVEAGFQRDEIVLLPPGAKPEGSFDGVVFAGGVDVDPSRYGARKAHPSVEVDEARDSTEFAVFEKARAGEVPILGICRGMQLVNVALGGTLHQDIPSEHPSTVVHNVPARHPERRDHTVKIEPGTRLARIAQAKELAVNSRHHQAIEHLAPGVRVAAVAPDGLIEAFESAGSGPWLLAVQWHPENLIHDEPSRRIFAEFARVVRERAGIWTAPGLLTRA
jgi:putative glutamine amidotransferase